MRAWRWSHLGPKLLIVIAGLMLLTILLPAEMWTSPESDGSYAGFDSALMYMDTTGSGHAAGAIEVEPESLTLSALPGSAPVVHLATSPLSYTSSFSVTLREAHDGSEPFHVAVWAPFENHVYRLAFESEPTRRVLLQNLHQGEVIAEEALGVYTVDQEYRIRVEIDRSSQSVSITARSAEGDTFSGEALVVESSSVRFASHILSESIPVVGEASYSLEAVARALAPGSVGMSIEWLDSELHRIDIVSHWERRESESGWSGLAMSVEAPDGAASARVEVATDDGANALFSNLHLASLGAPAVNLLPNGDFDVGPFGWRRADGTEPLETRSYAFQEFSGLITELEWPELFDSTRLAVTVEASSTTGFAVARIEDHRLDLAHDRWLAVRVTEPYLKSVVAVLGGLGLAILAGLFRSRLRDRDRDRIRPLGRDPLAALRSRRGFTIVVLVALFLVGNALLSRIGSSNADVVGARTWGHTVSTRGIDNLYFSTNLASVEAEQWRGLPLQEAGFPYGPTMAYITAAQALSHKVFLDTPVVSGNVDALVVLAKLVNALFALADAAIIYLIIRRTPARAAAYAGALAFLLNPAVWFAGSVWGSSQAVSLLFLLLALYFTQTKSLPWAWAFVLASVLTRPQYLIPAVLLAIYLARQARAWDTVIAASKAVIGVYVAILPFSLLISPTLPVDNLVNAFFLHVGNGNDAWTLPLSWGGLSIWPLAAPLFFDIGGVDRVLFPAQTEAFGSITFHQAGTVLVGGAVVLLVVGALLHRAEGPRRVSAAVLMAASAMALFTLNTATPTYHYILPLALIIVARPSLPRRVYWGLVTTVTTTTFLSMYAMGAYWLTRHPTWSVGVYDDNNPVAQVFATLAEQDWFIVIGSVANLVVLVVLMVFALIPRIETHVDLKLRESPATMPPLDTRDPVEYEGAH